MTILVIPTDSAPGYVQTTTLEGTSYTLSFQFNQRCQSWYLSVADSSGVDIYNGVKLMVGMRLFRKCKDPRIFPGDMLVLSSTADVSPPGLTDLLAGSGRCTLFYVTSDWLTALQMGSTAGNWQLLPGTVTLSQGSQVAKFSQQQPNLGSGVMFSTQPGVTYPVASSQNALVQLGTLYTGPSSTTALAAIPAGIVQMTTLTAQILEALTGSLATGTAAPPTTYGQT